MITYNPKDWWRLIFAFHRSDTFRMLLPAIFSIAVFTGVVAYVETVILHLSFKNTTIVHSLIGFVLSLLLVFRTNSAYDRWWEGRKIWGSFNNNSRNLAIKLNALLPKNDIVLRERLRILICNYTIATKDHLREGVKFEELIACEKYPISYYKQFSHVPNGIAKALTEEIVALEYQKIISQEHLLFLNNELQSFTDNVGACERIRNTPIPYTYSIFIKKIIFVYVISMPFGFVMEFGYWAIPIVVTIFYTFASIELIGEEIEDPFGEDSNDLPTDQITQRISENLKEIL
jgi:putative membrane protein